MLSAPKQKTKKLSAPKIKKTTAPIIIIKKKFSAPKIKIKKNKKIY